MNQARYFIGDHVYYTDGNGNVGEVVVACVWAEDNGAQTLIPCYGLIDVNENLEGWLNCHMNPSEEDVEISAYEEEMRYIGPHPVRWDYLSVEEITDRAYAHWTNERTRRREINQLFRLQDESNLWPISGKFNVTERAIRHVRAWEASGGYFDDGAAGYARAVDAEIGRIVNDPKNS